MNKKEPAEHLLYQNDSSVTAEKRGEIPCLIVHSDKAHVEYINNILNPIRDLLPDLGFNAKFLSEEMESLKHYGYTVEQLASQCSLGIVILDGLRPNVLFELGILFGKNKPIIVIQDEEAKVSIKSYYDNNFTNSKLTETQFNRLCNPPLGYFKHISDLGGLHSIKVNRRATIDDKNHPKKVLKVEIEKIKSDITDEYNRILLDSEPQITGKHFEEFQSIVLKISGYYTNNEDYEAVYLEGLYKSLQKLEEITKNNIQYQLYSNIAALYIRLAEKQNHTDISVILSYFDKASEIYNRILCTVSDVFVKAEIQVKQGDIFYKKSQIVEISANCKIAIKSYNEALMFFTRIKFPIKHAEILSNLGITYRTMASVENLIKNCKTAINVQSKALKIFTFDMYPLRFSTIQNNLAYTFSTLADVENSTVNCKKAIIACKEALKVRTYNQYPAEYATAQLNLGAAYGILAFQKDKQKNSKSAINAFKEALKVFTYNASPLIYSKITSNLGQSYSTLADIEDAQKNLEEAIKYCKAALVVRKIDNYPMEYAMTQVNLGVAYARLGKIKETEKYCKLSFDKHKQALKVFKIEIFPMQFAKTQRSLAYSYILLATVKNKTQNCKNAINALKNSLMVYTIGEYPEKHNEVQNSLKSAKEFCAEKIQTNNK